MTTHYKIQTNLTTFYHYARNKKECRELAEEVMKKFVNTLGYKIVKISRT